MSFETIVIRSACKEDTDTIVEFNTAMALETEHRQLEPETLREGILALMGSPEYGHYIIAQQQTANGAKPVGQLMITFEWSDWRNGLFWWLQSVYVLPAHRRLGVYRAMHHHVLTQAKANPRVCGIRLYVERQNHRAQTVYQRVGLTPSGYTVFEQDFVLGHKAFQK